MFFKKKKNVALSTSLTSTFYSRDILEHLSKWERLFICLPQGKERTCRVVKSGDNGENIDVGHLSADFTKMLLSTYPNCQYKIKSHKITFKGNAVGCDVVVEVVKH